MVFSGQHPVGKKFKPIRRFHSQGFAMHVQHRVWHMPIRENGPHGALLRPAFRLRSR
jgi:hypothetical protein